MSLKPTSSWFDVIVALVGAVTIVVGVSMVFAPAGVVCAGVFLIVLAYLRRALEVLHGDS